VITDDELARVSPLAFAHVISNGHTLSGTRPSNTRATPWARRPRRGGRIGRVEVGVPRPGALRKFPGLRLEGHADVKHGVVIYLRVENIGNVQR